MPIPRIAFEQLPADARRAVADKTGTVHHTETMTGGMNSSIASVLHTGSGPVFVKGIPADHHQVDAQRREAAVAPHLPPPAPAFTGTSRPPGGACSDTRSSTAGTPTTRPARPTSSSSRTRSPSSVP